MKPIHEQEWAVYPLDGRVVINDEGLVVADVREPLSTGGQRVARIMSAAPNMARALLADMVMGRDGVMHDEFRCPFLSGGECADWCAQKRAALKKAGALS